MDGSLNWRGLNSIFVSSDNKLYLRIHLERQFKVIQEINHFCFDDHGHEHLFLRNMDSKKKKNQNQLDFFHRDERKTTQKKQQHYTIKIIWSLKGHFVSNELLKNLTIFHISHMRTKVNYKTTKKMKKQN
jgi:hypothetical protein